MFEHRYAFLIACQSYIDSSDRLRTPKGDIEEISRVLSSQYAYKTVVCIDPSRIQLQEFLQRIPRIIAEDKNIASDTQVLIYYAGHGIALEVDQGIRGFLVPIDARRKENGRDALADTSVSMDELVLVMQQLPCQQILAVLDCCFAGSVHWSTATYRSLSTGASETKIRYRQQMAFYQRHRSLQVLTSTSHNQLALDSFGVREDAQATSPFARIFLQVLQGGGTFDHTNVLAIDDVKGYVNQRLNQQYQLNQGAELFTLQEHDSGSFLFLNKQFNDHELPEKPFINPYKGLNPYELGDAGLYYGRERAVDELLALITLRKPIVVAGASGSGKSSLVKAGLLPKLLHINDYRPDQILTIKPGNHPLKELLRAGNDQYAIVVVDQLEQLITQAADNSAAAVSDFLQHLLALSQIVICTVRTDFEAQLFKSSTLISSLSMYRLRRLEREDIERIIALPSLRVGRYFYPERLVQQIVDDFLSYPNSLPLLSLVLYELFDKGQQDPYREITPEDYEKLQGLTGVLGLKLDQVYTQLASLPQRGMLQNILVRMTSVRDSRVAGKRVRQSELLFNEPEQQQTCAVVISLLASEEYRLVLSGSDERAQQYWEPSHDVVVQAWATRREWAENINNGTLALREELAEAIVEYDAHHKDSQYLWSSDPNLLLLGERPKARWSQLRWDWQPFAQTFAKAKEWFTKSEHDFVQQSFHHRKLQRAAARGLVTLVVLALAVGSYFFYQLFQEQQRTKAAYLVSEAHDLSLKSPSQAYWLLKDAARLDPVNPRIYQEVAGLYDLDGIHFEKALFEQGGAISTAIFSPNGQRVLTASDNGTAKLWTLNGKLVAHFDQGSAISSAIFSSDGQRVLTVATNSLAKLWTLSGKLVNSFDRWGAITKAIFSPDDQLVMTMSFGHSVKIWNLKDELVANCPLDDPCESAAFSPLGTKQLVLTVSGQGTAQLWTCKGKLVAPLGPIGSVATAMFSPDGECVITVSDGGAVQQWSLDGKLIASLDQWGTNSKAILFPDGQKVLVLTGRGHAEIWTTSGKKIANFDQRESVSRPIFSPDGQRVLMVADDKTGKLWNLQGELVSSYNHSGSLLNPTFSPDGQQLLTASYGGIAQLWKAKGELATCFKQRAMLSKALFSPNGQQVLTVSDRSSKLWTLKGELIADFEGGFNVKAIFSPDGQHILTMSADGLTKQWTLKGEPIDSFNQGPRAFLSNAIFSPDGKLVLTKAARGAFQLWSLNGELVGTIKQELDTSFSNAVFSPDGQQVLITSDRGKTPSELWTIKGKWIARFSQSNSVIEATFSPDGQRILTVSTDGSSKLWTLKGEMITSFGQKEADHALFSPDGQQVLTVAVGKIARLWTLDGKLLTSFSQEIATRNVVFSPDGKYILTIQDGTTAQLWTLNDELIARFSQDRVDEAIFAPDGQKV